MSRNGSFGTSVGNLKGLDKTGKRVGPVKGIDKHQRPPQTAAKTKKEQGDKNR